MSTEWERQEMDVARREDELAESEGFNYQDDYDDCSHDMDYDFDDPDEAEQFSRRVAELMRQGYSRDRARELARRGH